MIRADHAVFGVHGAAFHHGQQIPLHPLAGDVGLEAFTVAADLVDLVQKDDAALLHPLPGRLHHLVHVDKPLAFLLDEQFIGVLDLDPALLAALRKDPAEHVPKLHPHVLQSGHGHDLHLRARGLDLHLHQPLVKSPVAPHLAQLLPGGISGSVPGGVRSGLCAFHSGHGRWSGRSRRLGQEQVQQALLSQLFGLDPDFLCLLLAHHAHADFHQVADH